MSQSSAAKVGIISFIMIVAISALLVWKSGIFMRAAGYKIIGSFNNIQGLLVGAEVRYRGYEVGKVSKIYPNPTDIKVHFWVYSSVKIPKNSELRIVFDGLIGERYIGIAPNPKEQQMIKPGDMLYGYATSGLADFVDVGTQNLEQTKAILETFRAIVTSENVTNAMSNTILAVEKITHDLSVVMGQLEQLSSTDNTKSIFESLKTFAIHLNKTTEVLFKDGKLATSISDTTADLAIMSENLKLITSDLHQNVLNEALFENLEKTLSNLSSFTAELNNLLADQSVKKNLVATIREGGIMFEKSGNLIKGIGSTEFSTNLNLEQTYSTDMTPVKASYLLDWDIHFQKSFLRLGFGDKLEAAQLLNVQQGVKLTDNLTTRYGLFNMQPGIGIDYLPFSRWLLTAEVFNFNALEFYLLNRFLLLNNVDLVIGLNRSAQDQPTLYSFGISVHPAKQKNP